MILHAYRVACDCCPFVSREFDTAMALDLYILNDEDADGKWLVTRRRRICRNCIIARACRIVGHQIVSPPHRSQSFCTRCQTFQAVAP